MQVAHALASSEEYSVAKSALYGLCEQDRTDIYSQHKCFPGSSKARDREVEGRYGANAAPYMFFSHVNTMAVAAAATKTPVRFRACYVV